MEDEYDVDAMLEAAYHNKSEGSDHGGTYGPNTAPDHHHHHRSSRHGRDRGGDRGGESNGDRSSKRGGGEEGRSSRDKHGRRRSRSKDRKESKRGRSGSPSGRSSRRRRSSRSPPPPPLGGSRGDKSSRKSSRSRSPKRKSRSSRSPPPAGVIVPPPTAGRRPGGRPGRSPTPPRLRLGPRRGGGGGGGGGGPGGPGNNNRSRSRSPLRLAAEEPLSPEERDARTVFCMQLSQRVRARDLEDFFSSVGKVRDVRMITCNKTRRFKGIAYVEFKDIDSVALALGLGGQKLLGIPIIVQPSQAEKNRAGQLAKAGAMAAAMTATAPGPMKLYVGSLHFNITEDMLKGIFEPFGRIDEILLMKDHETGRSKGFGFITFHEGEDAKRAMEQLNGFEIAGRPMKVGYVTEKSDGTYYANPQTFLDTDEMDRAGVNLGVTGRLQLMAKLAEGTDLKLPESATTALNLHNQIQANGILPPGAIPGGAAQAAAQAAAAAAAQAAPPIATQCFMLSNMFDASNDEGQDGEIRDEVLEACMEHGGAVHVYVDIRSPQGNVYVKCPSVASAVAAVNTFHGRWFAGRLVTAAYVPLLNYHSLFPDSMAAINVLRPNK